MRTSAETDRRDIARGAGVNYLGYVARLGSRVPFLFLAGVLYGASRFGAFTFGITVVETAAAIALFGLKRSLFKFMSESRVRDESVNRAIAGGAALALTAATVLTLAVASGADFLAGLFRLPSAAGTLLILTPALPMIVISDILLTAIRFTRQMRFEVYARSIAEPITLTVGIVIAYYAGARENGLAVGYVASLGVAAALSLLFFSRIFSIRACLNVRLDRADMRRLIAFSGPTAGYDLLTLLSDRVDLFLVSYFTPASVIGVYGMARQLSTTTKKVRQGFDRILPPILSESIAAGNLERARDQLAMVSRWILTVQLLILVVFLFYGDELLGLLDGGFAGGAIIVVLLMVGDAINGSLGTSELPIVYLRPGANVIFGAAMLVLGIATNVWLIGAFGAPGAAMALIITFSAVNAGRMLVIKRMFGFWTVRLAILKPLLAAAASAAAMSALQGLTAGRPVIGLVLGVPLLVTTYLAGLYLLGLESEDRRQVQSILDRIR